MIFCARKSLFILIPLVLNILQGCAGGGPPGSMLTRQDLTPPSDKARLIAYVHNTVYGSIEACTFDFFVDNVFIGTAAGRKSIVADIPQGSHIIRATYSSGQNQCPKYLINNIAITTSNNSTYYAVVSDAPLRSPRLELADSSEASDIVLQHPGIMVGSVQLGSALNSRSSADMTSGFRPTPQSGSQSASSGISANPSQLAAASAQTTSIPSGVTSGQLLPVIATRELLQTSSDTVTLSGKVGGNGRLVSLKVDGSDAPYDSSGSFSFSRAVPIGDSNIKLIATNEWGKSAEASIRVMRNLSETVSAVLSPLNPDRMRAKANPKAVALIIGVERYKNAPPAEYADKDAQQFYDYAVHALGVPRDRIKLMSGSEAGNLDIEKALRAWVKPLVVKGQSDVFVFFSGHGLASEDGKDLFLLPYDGDRDLLDKSAIRRKELIQMAVDAGAKSATLFLDTCYSGGTRGTDTLIASARPILIAAKQQDVPPNVTILAAAGNDQLSSSLAQVQHGLFSYFLMKGMEGDAAGADHTITAAKLEAYLAEHVPSEAAKLGRTQTPQLIGDGERVISAW